nr:hypothetical protein [Paenibacillus aurantius]
MKQLEAAMLEALRTGSVSVPYLLLSNYSQLSLSETEVMLLVHLMAFLEKEGKEFPTIEEIQSRMSAAPEAVIQTLQKLLKGGWMSIDETTDPDSGIRYEKYNLEGMRAKLAAHWAAGMAASAGRRSRQRQQAATCL